MKCEVRSVKCEVWSVKFQVRSAKSAVKSVECEDFALSLAEKIKRLSREGHGRDRVSLNYRSFMFGKLPPPACPGLCYIGSLKNTCQMNHEVRDMVETRFLRPQLTFSAMHGGSKACLGTFRRK